MLSRAESRMLNRQAAARESGGPPVFFWTWQDNHTRETSNHDEGVCKQQILQ